MLSSEAVLLGHPMLQYLWHARRTERALLTYLVEGVATQVRYVPGLEMEARPRNQNAPKLERGPILLCIDTSGSMDGDPETVAKALALEACLTAKREHRHCYLYAFSGAGQVMEQELSLERKGIHDLQAFLTCSFGGGTDVDLPLQLATERLGREGWEGADILMISDGGFSVPEATLQRVDEAKQTRRLRVHGVLVGESCPGGMTGLCDPLHIFSGWDLGQGRREVG